METDNCENYSFKVVLLGEGAVGKTSLVLRYIEDKFNDRHISTLQASFVTKKVNISGKRVNLAIWDTAGQEKFHALGPIYYRMSNGAVLVYDITDEDSFQKVKNWVKELRKMLGNEICLIIAGNKVDLEKNRNVSTEEVEQYANEVNAKHVLVSAKLNRGVHDLFIQLCDLMLQKVQQANRDKEDALNNRTGSLRRNILMVDDDVASETSEIRRTKSRCCGGTSSY